MKNADVLKNQNGLASIEALPLIAVFLMFVGYGLGMFGVIHSGILHSIGARTYAFESFNNRSNLLYHRDRNHNDMISNQKMGIRFHGINAPGSRAEDTFRGTPMPIAIGKNFEELHGNVNDHNQRIYNITNRRNQSVAVNPAWVMIGYGLCLNVRCGER